MEIVLALFSVATILPILITAGMSFKQDNREKTLSDQKPHSLK